MSSVEKLIYYLQATMNEPKPFGWFHLLWLGMTIASLTFLYFRKDKHNEKQLKSILIIYGVGSLIFELLKQIIWSFEYDPSLMIVSWDYPWYIFPFQLCSTPMYVAILCAFLKNGKVRMALLSYLSYITIWGSLLTIILPESCFVDTIIVNIHTMYLHCGSFVVSVYLLMTKEVKLNLNYFLKAFATFTIFVLIALTMNIFFYNFIVPIDESFNMFYINPYLSNDLPILSEIQANYPYIVYILSYLFAFLVGASVILGIGKIFNLKR